MSAGLFGLLDDVAVLARLAAASGRATAKAVGVVIDDTAVTPQYVHGIAAERELPIIKRIAIGSLRNKLLVILPAAMLLSQFAPRLLTPILMLGAVYLCYEGAEKIWESIRGHDADAPPVAPSPAPGLAAIALLYSVRLAVATIFSRCFVRDRLLPAWLWLIPVRDMLAFFTWALSFLGNRVEWRGSRFRLRPGGKIEELA